MDSLIKNKLNEYIKDIKKRRLNQNISQLKLSKLANLSQSIIAKLEAGKIEPNFSTIIKIEETLSSLENLSGLKAEDIMIKDIAFVLDTDTIFNALKIMQEKDYSQLLVIKNDILIGTIYEKTLLKALSNNIDIKKELVNSILEPNPILISKDYPISDLSFIFQNKNTSFVVVFEKNNAIGIITKSDLFLKE